MATRAPGIDMERVSKGRSTGGRDRGRKHSKEVWATYRLELPGILGRVDADAVAGHADDALADGRFGVLRRRCDDHIASVAQVGFREEEGQSYRKEGGQSCQEGPLRRYAQCERSGCMCVRARGSLSGAPLQLVESGGDAVNHDDIAVGAEGRQH